jgi:hypothetical protein
MWALLDARGAQYPAEHNVGHLYVAKPSLVNHYRNLDPCNCFNPGIGRTSKFLRWGELRSDGVRLQCDDVEVSDRPAARSVEAGTRGGLGPCRPI